MALMVNYIIVGVYVYMCECDTDACTACNKHLGLLVCPTTLSAVHSCTKCTALTAHPACMHVVMSATITISKNYCCTYSNIA